MINIKELQSAKNKLKVLIPHPKLDSYDIIQQIRETIELLEKQETYLENLSNQCIIWSIDDFKGQAEENWKNHIKDYPNATKWEDVYDETQFEYALESMIRKHDANYGIGWQTVDYYLDEYCLKK